MKKGLYGFILAILLLTGVVGCRNVFTMGSDDNVEIASLSLNSRMEEVVQAFGDLEGLYEMNVPKLLKRWVVHEWTLNKGKWTEQDLMEFGKQTQEDTAIIGIRSIRNYGIEVSVNGESGKYDDILTPEQWQTCLILLPGALDATAFKPGQELVLWAAKNADGLQCDHFFERKNFENAKFARVITLSYEMNSSAKAT